MQHDDSTKRFVSSKYLQKFCATKTPAEDFLSFPYNTLVSITPSYHQVPKHTNWKQENRT